MAMTYQNFASLGVNLNRQKYGPLDISNVFTSAADLKYYLTKGTFTEGVSEYWYKNANEKVVPYPYEGQVLATVIDGVVSVYALALDADGNFTTQEIGAKIETDDKTIKLVDGKLELVGLPADAAGKTYVPSYVNGVLTWAEPDTSTAEGQQQAIDGLNTRVTSLEETINGKTESAEGAGDAVVGLVERVEALESVDYATQDELDAAIGVASVPAVGEPGSEDYKEGIEATGIHKVIEDALQAAKDYADAQDADTIYDDTVLVGRVAAIEETLDGTDETDGLVDIVAANTQEIADLKTADTTTLNSAKTYTDEEIIGLDVAIEQKEGVEYIVIKNKAGTEVASVNASKFVQDSFLDDVSYDSTTGKVTFTWKMGDGSTKTDEIEIGDLVDTYTAGTGLTLNNNVFAVDTDLIATVEALNAVSAIADAAQTADEVTAAINKRFETEDLSQYAVKSDVESTLEGYYTKTDIDGKGYAVASDVANTYATKDALTTHEESIANDLLSYAKTDDVNADLAKKVENATIAHAVEAVEADPENGVEAVEGIPEGVTKDGTTLKIVIDAPTRAETIKLIADKVQDVTGGESAADVKLLLEAEVARSTAKDTAHDSALAILQGVETTDGSVAQAKALAQKGVDDAATVAGNLNTLGITVADNTREIGVAKSSIETVNSTLSGKITALENADTTINSNITALQGIVTGEGGHASKITSLEGRATNLENEDVRLAALIQGNTDKFANYSTTSQMTEAIEDAISGANLSTYAKVTDVEAIYKAGVDGSSASGVLAEEIARATAAEQANTDAIAAIIGIDTGKTIRAIAKEEVATIVGAAPEALNTLEEVANWIANDKSGAAAMANDIAALKTAVGDAESGLVKAVADNAAAIAAIVQPKGSTEVTVAEDGTLGLGQVSTDKLVLGENTLILDGGSATE